MFGSLPGNIYILTMDRDDLPPEKFEKIISPFFAWSEISRKYFFEKTSSSFDIRMTPQDPYKPSHHRGAENTQAKEHLERMLRRGDAVKISDRPSRGVGECFYINDEGMLICTDPYAFDSSGSEDIIRAYNRAVARREHIYRGGKPRPTQMLFGAGYYPPEKEPAKQPVSSSAAAIAGVMAATESTTLRGDGAAIASRIPQANPIAAAASTLFYSAEVGKGSDIIPPEYKHDIGDGKITGPNLGAIAQELGGASSDSPGGWGPEDEETARGDNRIGSWTLEELSKATQHPDPSDKSGQLSLAGRALQKHGGRPGSIIPTAKGNPSAINQQAQKVVDSILNDPAKSVSHRSTGRFGKVMDIASPKNGGLRYSSNGDFIGFLEPPL